MWTKTEMIHNGYLLLPRDLFSSTSTHKKNLQCFCASFSVAVFGSDIDSTFFRLRFPRYPTASPVGVWGLALSFARVRLCS